MEAHALTLKALRDVIVQLEHTESFAKLVRNPGFLTPNS